MRSRFILGIVLLLVLALAGQGSAGFLQFKNESVAATLEQARVNAIAGDVVGAMALASDAENVWKKNWHAIAAMADHAPMDEIDSLFKQMQVYGNAAHATELAAYCARLSQLIRAIPEAHSFSWWNLL